MEFPLEFCNVGSSQKLGPRRWKEFDDVYVRFDTIPECDGQTDERTDRFAITVSRSACIGMPTRDKNRINAKLLLK